MGCNIWDLNGIIMDNNGIIMDNNGRIDIIWFSAIADDLDSDRRVTVSTRGWYDLQIFTVFINAEG